MDTYTKKFREVFEEHDNFYRLLCDIEIQDEKYTKGATFSKGYKMARIDIFKFHYLDLAIVDDEEDRLKIVGFYPQDN